MKFLAYFLSLFVLLLVGAVALRGIAISVTRPPDLSYAVGCTPAGLGIQDVLYVKEEISGSIYFPLPGDNEGVIYVYRLPADEAEKIKQYGIAYLDKLPKFMQNKCGDVYYEWRETPIVPDARNWIDTSAPVHGNEQSPISLYLNKYVSIEIDKDVESIVNSIINEKGNFYAYGRIGVIIISPSHERVIFAFAG